MSGPVGDWLVYRGQRRVLDSTPLEPYLRRLPGPVDFRLGPTVTRLGYVAHWEVRADDTLWLTRLETRPADQGPDPGLGLLFPDAAGPVPATWVSQLLRSPGEKRYTFGGPTTARELHLWVLEGRVLLAEEHRPGAGRLSYEFTPHLEAAYGPEEGAFLRAIYAAPTDSAPRLVYADWLDERNDPRGPVIRLAERLKELSPDAQRAEQTAHLDVLRRGLRQDLWSRVLGYDALAASAHGIWMHPDW